MKFWTCSFSCALCSLIVFSSWGLAQKAENYRVSSLPGIDIDKLPFEQYAGHIEVSSETDGNLFFWMLHQVQPTQPEKLIIWFNGGPGCSSMDGLFLENGPYRVNPDLSLTVNAHGWQDHATIVFLDQPVGTGFSFADGDGLLHNMTQVVVEFTTFLEKFMDIFPYLKNQDLYLAGESYAGTYIPYFANRVLELNKKDTFKYNLKGIAIGNGWISPTHQYEAYYDFSVMNNLLEGQHLDRATRNLKECRIKLSKELRIKTDVCEDILQDTIINSIHMGSDGTECINTYDIRLKNESYPSCGLTWPYELTDVNKYLRTSELTTSIHSEKQALGWQECARPVSAALRNDPSRPADMLLPDLLKEIEILLFSGEFDLICNHLGTEYMIGNMTWNGATGFKDAERQEWVIGKKTVGYYMQERNLSYVLINDGSHMVPYDKPMETLDMINRFMGVGDNMVNGLPSRVGNNDNNQQQPPTHNDSSVHDNDDEEKTSDNTSTAESDDDTGGFGLGGYAKSTGSYGALVILIILVALCACCYRFKSKDSSQNTTTGSPSNSLWQRFIGIFGIASANQRTKFSRLDDQDDTNELDELVVDNPTLFDADHDSEPSKHHSTTTTTHVEQVRNTNASQFAIDDDSDDGFDDFADWDEEATLNTAMKKDDKDH
ncbi:Alpha/Beta hydrolase protein [Absidia repens]|uniref:Carboxypeptidase n=1 Tax=Absidia repens TaxID=90262 RepID=A0A1X2I852_9FUNG|nr:Alpha/Beta hydrolase protein [Absidia repens]